MLYISKLYKHETFMSKPMVMDLNSLQEAYSSNRYYGTKKIEYTFISVFEIMSHILNGIFNYIVDANTDTNILHIQEYISISSTLISSKTLFQKVYLVREDLHSSYIMLIFHDLL